MAEKRRKPSTTVEAREDDIIALAYNAVEQRIRDGKATGPELVHFLRMGSPAERLDREIKQKQRELLEAKTEAIHAAKRVDEMYERAISAMKRYGGEDND